ncbi:hypothetical protein CEXT_189901, partial [Caerostris extrusa]
QPGLTVRLAGSVAEPRGLPGSPDWHEWCTSRGADDERAAPPP